MFVIEYDFDYALNYHDYNHDYNVYHSYKEKYWPFLEGYLFIRERIVVCCLNA